MKNGSKVGIVCCSNGQLRSCESQVNALIEAIKKIGLIPIELI